MNHYKSCLIICVYMFSFIAFTMEEDYCPFDFLDNNYIENDESMGNIENEIKLVEGLNLTTLNQRKVTYIKNYINKFKWVIIEETIYKNKESYDDKKDDFITCNNSGEPSENSNDDGNINNNKKRKNENDDGSIFNENNEILILDDNCNYNTNKNKKKKNINDDGNIFTENNKILVLNDYENALNNPPRLLRHNRAINRDQNQQPANNRARRCLFFAEHVFKKSLS